MSIPNGTRQPYSAAMDVELSIYNYVRALNRAPLFLALTAKQWEKVQHENRERRSVHYVRVLPDCRVSVQLDAPWGEKIPEVICNVRIVEIEQSEGVKAYREQIARDDQPEALAA